MPSPSSQLMRNDPYSWNNLDNVCSLCMWPFWMRLCGGPTILDDEATNASVHCPNVVNKTNHGIRRGVLTRPHSRPPLPGGEATIWL